MRRTVPHIHIGNSNIQKSSMKEKDFGHVSSVEKIALKKPKKFYRALVASTASSFGFVTYLPLLLINYVVLNNFLEKFGENSLT